MIKSEPSEFYASKDLDETLHAIDADNYLGKHVFPIVALSIYMRRQPVQSLTENASSNINIAI